MNEKVTDKIFFQGTFNDARLPVCYKCLVHCNIVSFGEFGYFSCVEERYYYIYVIDYSGHIIEFESCFFF